MPFHRDNLDNFARVADDGRTTSRHLAPPRPQKMPYLAVEGLFPPPTAPTRGRISQQSTVHSVVGEHSLLVARVREPCERAAQTCNRPVPRVVCPAPRQLAAVSSGPKPPPPKRA